MDVWGVKMDGKYGEFISEKSLKEHLPISELALRLLRKNIIEGKLPPGSKLSERELAERWGISRTPIREAIKQLQSEGLVVSIPRKGVIVRKYTPREIEDVYTVRLVLESLAVKLSIPNLDERRMGKIINIHENLKRTLEKGDSVDLLKVVYMNEEFHFSIYEASGNKILCDTIRGLWHKIFAIIMVVIASPDRGFHMICEHEAIVKGLVERSEEKALKALEEHMKLSRSILLQYYGTF